MAVQAVWYVVKGIVTIKLIVLGVLYGLGRVAAAADQSVGHPMPASRAQPELLSPEIVSELEPDEMQTALWQQAQSLVEALLLAFCLLMLLRVVLYVLRKLRARHHALPLSPLDPLAAMPSIHTVPIRITPPMTDDVPAVAAIVPPIVEVPIVEVPIVEAVVAAPSMQAMPDLPHSEPPESAVVTRSDTSVDTDQPLPIEPSSDLAAYPSDTRVATTAPDSATAGTVAPSQTSSPPVRQMGDTRTTSAHSGAWQLFATSQQGQGHLAKTPAIACQDSHAIRVIDASWGVAVVCDGAGSQSHSQLGAAYVAEEIAAHLAAGIPETQIYKTCQLPSEEAWRQYCKALVLQTRMKLEAWIEVEAARDPALQGVGVGHVGCTLIWLVYTPMGLLTGHLGDGRAGYLDADGWQAMMMPWEGEYANQTVFINSDFIYADQLENPREPAKPYLETRVIATQTVRAFVLMSDGCEHGLYETIGYDPASNSNISINKPHAGICDHMIQLLTEQMADQDDASVEQFFAGIVDHGNSALRMENDDKTLVLGFVTANPAGLLQAGLAQVDFAQTDVPQSGVSQDNGSPDGDPSRSACPASDLKSVDE